MKTKYDGHTPGPWKLHKTQTFEGPIPDNANFQIEFGPGDWGGFWVVAHNGVDKSCKRVHPLVDGNLIKDTPALLAALTKIVEADTRANTAARIGTSSECHNTEAQIHAAIDEARKLIQAPSQ